VTQKVIAFLGISGVGKTTLLRKVSPQIAFQHLQASALIREGRQYAETADISIDALRNANIDENQKFLLIGYDRSVDPRANLVIVDGHSIIDKPSGLVEIEAEVFSALGVTRIIFLTDVVEEIFRRRQADTSRNRPARDMKELEKYQSAALVHTLKICCALRVPMCVITPSQSDELERQLTCLPG
jgi:adenylate kinase